MELNNPFYQSIISSLNFHHVDYILIGGLAVGFHGYSRYTGDMDLWVKPSISNMSKLYDALLDLGYPADLVNSIKANRKPDDPTPIKLWDDSDSFKVDLMTDTFQKEFSWEECKEESGTIKIGENYFSVIHINHLIQMKKNTKRMSSNLKDLVDAEELSKIRDAGKEG